MRFPDVVELLAATEQVDADGTPVKVPAGTGPESPAVVQVLGSTEDTAAGQRIVLQLLLMLPPEANIDGFGAVRWRGDLYEVDGDVLPIGFGSVHHYEATLRRVR